MLSKGTRHPCTVGNETAVTGSLNSWGKFFTSIESDECVWSATHFNESCCDTMEKCFSPQFLDGETRLPLEPEEVPRALREATYPRKAPSGANTAASLPSFLPSFPRFPARLSRACIAKSSFHKQNSKEKPFSSFHRALLGAQRERWTTWRLPRHSRPRVAHRLLHQEPEPNMGGISLVPFRRPAWPAASAQQPSGARLYPEPRDVVAQDAWRGKK